MLPFIAMGQAIVGLILLYMAFFLHEKEERQLTERIAEWWIHVDDAATAALTWHTRLFRLASQRLVQLIDFVFGERLLSLGALWTAILFGGAIYVVLSGEGIDRPWILPSMPPGVLSLVLVVTGVLPAFGVQRTPLRVGYVILLSTWLGRFAFDSGMVRTEAGIVSNRLMLLISIGSVLFGGLLLLVFVAAIRTLSVFSSDARNTARHLMVVVCEVVVVWTVFSPMYILAYLIDHPATGIVAYAALCLSIRTLFIGMAAFTIVMLHGVFVLLFLSHRLFWPVLQRPLYAAHRYKIVENHQLLATVGALLLLASGFSILRNVVLVLQSFGVRTG